MLRCQEAVVLTMLVPHTPTGVWVILLMCIIAPLHIPKPCDYSPNCEGSLGDATARFGCVLRQMYHPMRAAGTR
jgi:hypothetical protein